MAEKGDEDKNLFLSIIIMFTFAKIFFSHTLFLRRGLPPNRIVRGLMSGLFMENMFGGGCLSKGLSIKVK